MDAFRYKKNYFSERNHFLWKKKITWMTEFIFFGAGAIDPVTEKMIFGTQSILWVPERIIFRVGSIL